MVKRNVITRPLLSGIIRRADLLSGLLVMVRKNTMLIMIVYHSEKSGGVKVYHHLQKRYLRVVRNQKMNKTNIIKYQMTYQSMMKKETSYLCMSVYD